MAKPSGSAGTVLTTTSNGMPMKVLLVNTLKPNGVSSASTVSVAAKPIISTPLTTRSIVNIQPKPATVVQTNPNNIVQSTYQTRSTTAANAQATKTQTLLSSNKYLCSGSTSNAESTKKSSQNAKPGGFRTFLSQLVQLQQRQLEVSQKRLEVERERLDYERQTGDKILAVITSFIESKTKDEPK